MAKQSKAVKVGFLFFAAAVLFFARVVQLIFGLCYGSVEVDLQEFVKYFVPATFFLIVAVAVFIHET